MPDKKTRNGNQGFSLVELLIAVTILAIITVPIMMSFTTAARTNAKAKKEMDAEVVAESIFETIKSESVNDFLATGLQDVTSGTVTSSVVTAAVVGTDYQVTTASAMGLKANDSNRTFNARVVIDPTPYVTTSGAAVKATDYNSLEFATLSDLSASENAFFIQTETDELDAAREIGLLDESNNQISTSLKRRITIDVEHGNASGVSRVYATMEYYDATDPSAYYKQIDHVMLYDNSGMTATNQLSNVFVCFLPTYTGTRLTPQEEIIINNKDNYDVGVYIIKQTSRDDVEPYKSRRVNNSSNYLVNLTINENRSLNPSSADYVAGVCTRLTTNIPYYKNAAKDVLANKQLTVNYTGISAVPGGTKTEELFDLSDDLTRKDSSLHIYHVKIEIFDKDDTKYGKALTTMEGTKTE